MARSTNVYDETKQNEKIANRLLYQGMTSKPKLRSEVRNYSETIACSCCTNVTFRDVRIGNEA
jgi:hypothetical protein